MKIIKASLISLPSIGLFSITALPLAMAEEPTTEPTTTPVEERVNTFKDKVEASVDARCELMTSRIDLKITSFETNKNTHVERYNKVKSKVTAFLSKVEDMGYDVTIVRADLQVFDQMIKDFAQKYAAFITELKDTQNYACGESEGKFLAELEQAQKLLLDVRNQSIDMRLFVLETLKPHLQDLRNQKQ